MSGCPSGARRAPKGRALGDGDVLHAEIHTLRHEVVLGECGAVGVEHLDEGRARAAGLDRRGPRARGRGREEAQTEDRRGRNGRAGEAFLMNSIH